MTSQTEFVIRARKGWQSVDFGEIWRYRELLGFLVWRDIKIRYRQTLLGSLWAILQPLMATLLFTVFFNRYVGIQSDGPPYPLFAYAGLLTWTFFSNAVAFSSNSLVGNQQLISKIYFPRLFLPLGTMGAFILDMFLALGFMVGLLIWYHWPLTISVVWLPLFILGSMAAAGGMGLIFAALNVSFRDIKYVVPFLVQMLFFATPIIYPIRHIPAQYQILVGLNPMAGMVLGFRHALLGTKPAWDIMLVSLGVSLALFVLGLYVFRRMESHFADII